MSQNQAKDRFLKWPLPKSSKVFKRLVEDIVPASQLRGMIFMAIPTF